LLGARCRGADDEVGDQPPRLEPPTDTGRVLPAALRQRPREIRRDVRVPGGLGMAEDEKFARECLSTDVQARSPSLARIIHEFPTASVERTASSGPSPSGLLDIVCNYACVGLRSEGPESPALSTLSRRQPMNNPG
jgi:hypothetical protein